MPDTLAYCPDLPLVLDRLRRFYVERRPDLILATMDVPSRVLAELAETRPAGYCAYPDPAERAAFWDAYYQERSAVPDDSVPAAYLTEMDQGLYGGLVGGQVQFMFDPAGHRAPVGCSSKPPDPWPAPGPGPPPTGRKEAAAVAGECAGRHS